VRATNSKGLYVDEHLVEKLAVRFHALNVLLSWKPDAPITENALVLAARDPRSMRLMMAHQGNSLTITEDTLIAAADAPLGVEVMEAILNRQGSIPITEKVIRATCINRDMDALEWLLDRQPECFVREVWHDIWTDVDFDIAVRYTALFAFLKKTDSKITDTMLQDFPYDPSNPNNYGFGDFVKALCGLDDDEDDEGFPDLPATGRAAEIWRFGLTHPLSSFSYTAFIFIYLLHDEGCTVEFENRFPPRHSRFCFFARVRNQVNPYEVT
jgi:hypothetical protein